MAFSRTYVPGPEVYDEESASRWPGTAMEGSVGAPIFSRMTRNRGYSSV